MRPESSPEAGIRLTTLADFTAPSLIIPQLRGRDAPSVIQELSLAMQHEKRIPDFLPFYHAALNREFMVSTEMEAGMALPHARLPTLSDLSFALGRSAEPVAWGPGASGSVRLVFLMAIPATDSTQSLLVISGLARLTKEIRMVEELYAARDCFEMNEVLKRVTLRSRVPAGASARGEQGAARERPVSRHSSAR